MAAPVAGDLGEGFHDPVVAARFPTHRLRYRNQRWARRVGLDGLDGDGWERHFATFAPLPDNLERPLALRYHGHQFMVYNPALGDGRGFLFAQLRDLDDGRLLDLATKGSGQTPYSRGGDGRLTLKGGVREVLATEMLEALGVYTSKTFSLFETGEALRRHDEPSPTRSAVLVRLGHSHVRFGTFQRQAYEQNAERMCRLIDFAVTHYMPELAGDARLDGPARTAAFFGRVAEKTATLAASWLLAGFVHGVLNTDNMNITGESFDYGPYRFVPTFDPTFVAAYFDHGGLYAFGRQAAVLEWNLQQLGGALRLVCDAERLDAAGAVFRPALGRAVRETLLDRLGLVPREPELDQLLVDYAFAFLAESQMGYEQFFFDWYGGVVSEPRATAGPAASFYAGAPFAKVRECLADYVAAHPGRLQHAYFRRPRPCTLLIDEIEALWDAIAEHDDWSAFDAKLGAIAEMREAHGRGC
jgi:uncharacterized protein YdiU (UPF0061 family)